MLDVNNDAKVGFRRLELLTGPERRRRWSAEDKARIVQESLAPRARVADVARRWQLSPQQLFAWRRAARVSMTEKRSGSLAPGFVPIVAEDVPVAASTCGAPAASVIEVKLAGAVVRVVGGQHDGSQLTAVLRAVRASASRS